MTDDQLDRPDEAPSVEREIFDAAPEPAPEGEPAAAYEPSDEDPASGSTVPLGALHEERAKARRYKEEVAATNARLGAMQEELRLIREAQARAYQPQHQHAQHQPQEPPSIFEDEEGAIRARLDPVAEEMRQRVFQVTEFVSQREAVREHGAEAVGLAYGALQGAIRAGQLDGRAVLQHLRASPDPYGEILRWHAGRPDVARERTRREVLAEYGLDPDAPPRAAAGGTAAIPSLTRAQGSAGAAPSLPTEEDIFNAAPAFGKRRA